MQDVFLCIIELCRLYRDWWKAKLDYLIDLLESMKNEPQKYSTEWGCWEKTIDDVINKDITIANNFDWDFGIDHEALDQAGARIPSLPIEAIMMEIRSTPLFQYNSFTRKTHLDETSEKSHEDC